MNAINTRKFEQNGFTVVIEHFYDDDTKQDSPDVLQANYEGCSEEERATYFLQDKERYASWVRDEWCYIGVSARVLKQTSSNWANGGLEVGRCSIWAVESDDTENIRSIERDCVTDAFNEVERLKVALGISPLADTLKAYFPALGTDRDMNGADVVDVLNDLYETAKKGEVK